MSHPILPLGELCEMDREVIRSNDVVALKLPFVGVENVRSGSGLIDFQTDSRTGASKSTTFRFDKRHVLYAKLRPYLNKVATPDLVGRCSTELVPLLPRDGVNRFYLAYLLRRQATIDFVMSSITGSRMPRTDMKALLSMRVPLPPIREQRLIVKILNKATKIEQLQARAQQRLREFIPALFARMFGMQVSEGCSVSDVNFNSQFIVRLGDIATVVAGDPAPQDPNAFSSDGELFVRMQDVGLHHINSSFGVQNRHK